MFPWPRIFSSVLLVGSNSCTSLLVTKCFIVLQHHQNSNSAALVTFKVFLSFPPIFPSCLPKEIEFSIDLSRTTGEKKGNLDTHCTHPGIESTQHHYHHPPILRNLLAYFFARISSIVWWKEKCLEFLSNNKCIQTRCLSPTLCQNHLVLDNLERFGLHCFCLFYNSNRAWCVKVVINKVKMVGSMAR